MENKTAIVKKLEESRLRLIFKYPFYGDLLLHLSFALAADCQSAATDMKKIIFGPKFVARISNQQLDFVILHEILHCVLNHCVRGNGKNQMIYNIACDIVVNSCILHSMGKRGKFLVDGCPVMHWTPGGEEGMLYTAEEIYLMLLKLNEQEIFQKRLQSWHLVDSHENWNSISDDYFLAEEWKTHVKNAVSKTSGNKNLPPGIRKLIELSYQSTIDWRKLLNDFIKRTFDRYDYSFLYPDRRFSTADLILPSFSSEEIEKVDDLWFLIDTSGSVSDKELAEAYAEIKQAIELFDSLCGKLSFFDTSVSEPIEFDTIESLVRIKPVGGGGTSFSCIFDFLRDRYVHDNKSLPTAIIVITDGYADFPADESVSLDVPVLWIITSDESAPWGTTIHIK